MADVCIELAIVFSNAQTIGARHEHTVWRWSTSVMPAVTTPETRMDRSAGRSLPRCGDPKQSISVAVSNEA